MSQIAADILKNIYISIKWLSRSEANKMHLCLFSKGKNMGNKL